VWLKDGRFEEINGKLGVITERAAYNVDNKVAPGDMAREVADMKPDDPLYRLKRGSAIHLEVKRLITEAPSGELDKDIAFDKGRALPEQRMPNSFTDPDGTTLRPDIRLPLSNGHEAVWDITSEGQAGHVTKYGNFPHVNSIIEIYYPSSQ